MKETPLNTMELLTAACRVSMPTSTRSRNRRAAYWWTTEIGDLRKKCLRLRRDAQRTRDRAEAAIRSTEHKAAKKLLRKAITESEIRCW